MKAIWAARSLWFATMWCCLFGVIVAGNAGQGVWAAVFAACAMLTSTGYAAVLWWVER